MKLRVVPARTGMLWVRLGMKAFFKQPLALAGLFFLFMACVSVLSIVPVLGNIMALALLPAATLGLMEASRMAAEGKFPMPRVLASALTAGKSTRQAMLVLGGWYAVAFWASWRCLPWSTVVTSPACTWWAAACHKRPC